MSGKSDPADWTVHTTSDGKKYYHHKPSKTTQWEKPEALQSNEEKSVGSCVWKEYPADNGKKYYYNNVTGESVWEMPKDYKLWLDQQQTRASAPAPKAEQPKAELSDREKFRKCLTQHGMTHTWTVEQAMQTTKSDERWKLLKMADKKQVFQELSQQLRQQHRDAKNRKDNEARKEFIDMLIEHPEINEEMPYRDAVDVVKHDRRYIAISTDRERKRLFDKFRDEKNRRQKQQQREQRRTKRDAFSKVLAADKDLNVRTQWRRFKEKYAEHADFMALEPLDRLSMFEDYIRTLERAENEEFKRIKQEARLKARKARERFREFLHTQWMAGDITIKTVWKDYVPSIKFNAAYIGMMEVIGSTQAELFYDFQEELEDRLYKDKKIVKEMLIDAGVFDDMFPNCAFEDFTDKLKNNPKNVIVEPSNLKFIYEDFVAKAQRSLDKKKRKQHKGFRSTLKDTKDITKDSKWEEWKDKFMDVDNLNDEDKEQVFNTYIEDLKERENGDDRDKHRHRDHDRSRDRKDKRRRSSRRHRDDRDRDDRDKRRDKRSHRSKRDRDDYYSDDEPRSKRARVEKEKEEREEGELEMGEIRE